MKRSLVIGAGVAFFVSMAAMADGELPSTSLYVQNGLIGHLDAIDNGGVGVHVAAPATWTDLAGNHTFTNVNGAAFSSDNPFLYSVSFSPLSSISSIGMRKAR